MASVHDVASYILRKTGSISTWKLQKLAYYSQAWHLVWDEEPLFDAQIQAWANGPVVAELYKVHRGKYSIGRWPKGSSTKLSDDQKETIDAVLAGYGKMSGHQLSVLTHSEDPWIDARAGLRPTERSVRQIKPEAMKAFYTWLDAQPEAKSVADIDWEPSTGS